MKVLKASLWIYSKQVPNSHNLQILVDYIPKTEEMRFEHKKGCYFAENRGYVKFYYWSGKGNDGGFYGKEFDIIMKDGKKVTLKGAWSSRSGVMNTLFRPHCIEVGIIDNQKWFERGHAFYSGAITIDLAKRALEQFLPDWTIVKEIKYDNEIYYKVVRKDDLEDKTDNEFYRSFFKEGEIGNRYMNRL